MKIYRLKSNPKTYVQDVGEGWFKVIWSNSMYTGYDSQWMMSRQKKNNLIPSTAAERKKIDKDLVIFKRNVENFPRLKG